ncbi:hypothetical protein ACSBLW_09460 [Thioclava sp. FR2]|uniref:hypothetical protein n=1 Tax=Thioclava sp. FR2 TaxID=3445780 RepID=UPI003EBC110C
MTFLYFLLTLPVLSGLTFAIRAIAAKAGECPSNTAAARLVGASVALGYLTLGGGAVVVLAGLFAALGPQAPNLFFCAGLAIILLGLGFTHALTLLRASLTPRTSETASTPLEPVLA